MASLNQAWNIATGALAADQAAISVVAGNIANANTPGYTTETVQWGSADTVTVGGRSQAGGVTITGVTSQRDRVLNQRIDQQAQEQSDTAARLAALNDLQSVFAGAITATGSGSSSGVADIGQQLTAFFQSFSSLAADPSNTSLRTGVLSAAQSLAATFNQVSESLGQQRAGLDATVASAATQVNALTNDIADLNAKISTGSPTADAGHARRSAAVRYPAVIAARWHSSDNERPQQSHHHDDFRRCAGSGRPERRSSDAKLGWRHTSAAWWCRPDDRPDWQRWPDWRRARGAGLRHPRTLWDRSTRLPGVSGMQ